MVMCSVCLLCTSMVSGLSSCVISAGGPSVASTSTLVLVYWGREGGREVEGGKEGWREAGREGEGKKDGGKLRGRGRERRMEGSREGGGGKEGWREAEREGEGKKDGEIEINIVRDGAD